MRDRVVSGFSILLVAGAIYALTASLHPVYNSSHENGAPALRVAIAVAALIVTVVAAYGSIGRLRNRPAWTNRAISRTNLLGVALLLTFYAVTIGLGSL